MEGTLLHLLLASCTEVKEHEQEEEQELKQEPKQVAGAEIGDVGAGKTSLPGRVLAVQEPGDTWSPGQCDTW